LLKQKGQEAIISVLSPFCKPFGISSLTLVIHFWGGFCKANDAPEGASFALRTWGDGVRTIL